MPNNNNIMVFTDFCPERSKVHNSFEFRDILKQHDGRYHSDEKIWSVPNNQIEIIKEKQFIKLEAISRQKRNKWQKCLDHFNLKFAKKGTGEYEDVLKMYKSL